jgi:hypothetical protein
MTGDDVAAPYCKTRDRERQAHHCRDELKLSPLGKSLDLRVPNLVKGSNAASGPSLAAQIK